MVINRKQTKQRVRKLKLANRQRKRGAESGQKLPQPLYSLLHLSSALAYVIPGTSTVKLKCRKATADIPNLPEVEMEIAAGLAGKLDRRYALSQVAWDGLERTDNQSSGQDMYTRPRRIHLR